MSERYGRETALVTDESDGYDTALDTTIALSVVGFLLGMLTLGDVVSLTTSGGDLGALFAGLLAVVVSGVGVVGICSYANVIPTVSRRLRGIASGLVLSATVLTILAYALDVTLATLLGVVLLVQALGIGAAGVVSRLGLVDTDPDRSAGLLAGGAFGFLGLLIGGVVGGTLFGFGSPLSLAVALIVGLLLAGVTALPREDIGSTLSTAAIVALLGATIAAAVVTVEWQYDPSAIDGGFTGGVVVPLFVVFGSLLSSWAGAKCRAGYGAQGRQYGAFLLINLNAFLMVAVMAGIVLFVISKGVVYAFHGFTVGALTLLVLLAPLLLGALQWARTPAGSGEWHGAARQLLRVAPLAAIGSLTAVLVGVLTTGSTLSVPFEYTVLQNRSERQVETALSLTPSLNVGAWLLFLAAAVCAAYFLRSVGSLQNVGTRSERLARVQQALSLFVAGLGLLVVVLAVFGTAPFGLPLAELIGFPLTYVGAVAAACLLALPLQALVGSTEGLGERARDRSQFVTLGVYGGLSLLFVTALLETATAVPAGAGPFGIVTTVCLIGIGVTAVLAVGLASARRGADGDRRVLDAQMTLALGGLAGFVAVMALHVALTEWTVNLAGVTVANGGSLSWPFVMENRLPLAPDSGGIFPAIVGTVWLVVGASAFAIPLGVGAAVFLTEYAEQGYFTGLVEVATNALWSTPSVVFGLFGAAFLLPRFGGDTSLLAGQLVLGFMLLPLVLITSREAIKSVPDEYRDASAALGVSRWQTVRSVVLPAAMPGVITGVILGVGRIAGETAPLILVLGSSLSAPEPLDVLGGFQLLGEAPFVFNDALLAETPALPTGIWAIITAGVSGSASRGWATAFILLTVVLLFYAVGIATRTYFRRKLNYE
jgi:phosphate transport system permease protein